MAAPIRDTEWLAWVTKLLEGSAAQTTATGQIPSRSLPCLLDEQPTHLVPERLLRQLPRTWGGNELFVNPLCHLSSDWAIPSGLGKAAAALSITNDDQGTIAWVGDPATESWMPFWLTPELGALVVKLREDPAQIRGLPAKLRNRLQQAQILVDNDFATSRKDKWSETAELCREKFRGGGYAPVSGLIHPFQLGALRSHFRRQIRKGAYPLGDDQSPCRYIAHNDPVACFFHLQLTKAVSDLVGEAVKPSYVYMASYRSGARLEKHTDREQCEFSITMCVDYAPEPIAATPWPLYLDTQSGNVTVYQALGDGLLYRGRELPHYRKTLAAGNTSTSIFFHYVPSDFDGSLE